LAAKIDMSIYDEYQIVINEAQRRVIMRALTNAMADDRRPTSKGGALSRPIYGAYSPVQHVTTVCAKIDGMTLSHM
jgi:hypothetical protein